MVSDQLLSGVGLAGLSRTLGTKRLVLIVGRQEENTQGIRGKGILSGPLHMAVRPPLGMKDLEGSHGGREASGWPCKS